VDLVVLLGDVTDTATESELRSLRALWADRPHATIAVFGPRDLEAERLERVQSWLGPQRFAFVRNEQRFVGVAGTAVDAATRRFVGDVDGADALPLWWFGPAQGAQVLRAPPFRSYDATAFAGADGSALTVECVSVDVGPVARSERFSVPRGRSSVAHLRRFGATTLGAVATGTLTFAAALGACALALGYAYLLWRRAAPAVALRESATVGDRPLV
jgi:hypothetical protein